jgi:hypothetical protein
MAAYDAFISYSHAKDKPIAAALQSVMQTLGKPWYRRRALRIFRDDTSLSATPQLWPSIEQALGQSRFFILLASREAAASRWVNREVAYWLDHKGSDTLLIGLTDGDIDWNEAVGDFNWREGIPLPPVLVLRNEPKWVDLRAYRHGADPGDARFLEHAADFAAAIHGVPKDDLLSQEVRHQRRALTLAWSAVGSLTVLMLFAAWQWLEAEQARKAALAAEKVAVEQRQKVEAALRSADSRLELMRLTLASQLAVAEKLARAEPDNFDWQINLSDILERAGDFEFELNDRTAAAGSYRESMRIRERLSRLNDYPAVQVRLVSALIKLARVDPEPRQYLSRALEILRRYENHGTLSELNGLWGNGTVLLATVQRELEALAR